MIEKLKNSYQGKRVFLTGHTGFKGSWLAKWLQLLGAEVKGYSLAPTTEKSHFELLNLDMESVIADICDADKLQKEIELFKPDSVMHLAAQPLVRRSYKDPIETYQVNVMGTLNLINAVRSVESISAVVNVTTDKCYENREWIWGYREHEAMGGYDPYSSSKACSEILTASMRNSFFNLDDYGKKHNCLIATARAGNVIGGGDWSEDRIVPDIIRSIVNKETLQLRNPHATRPWQHVLEPLFGYLLLGAELLAGNKEVAQAFNFGPEHISEKEVEDVVCLAKEVWNEFEFSFDSGNHPHEAHLLRLDSAKAMSKLGWYGHWGFKTTIEKTIEWYKEFYQSNLLNTEKDIIEFEKSVVSDGR